MFIVNIVRFLLGYVCLSASGGFPERFINLCSRNGVNLWNLKSNSGIITACSDMKSYKKIRPCARKSGMKVRITEKHALSLVLKKHRFRSGLIAGAVIFFTVLSFLSTRIWSISVTGNCLVESERILEVMQTLDIAPGKSNKFTVSDYRDTALKMLPELNWIHVNVSGIKAVVEVREADPVPDSGEAEKCDLVACADGTLVTLRVFNGTRMVPSGSGVLKGDILISGFEENKNLTTDVSGAQGYAEAVTKKSISSSFFKKSEFTVQKPEAHRYAVIMFFRSLYAGKPENSDTASFSEASFLTLNCVVLPFGVEKTTVYSASPSCLTLTPYEYSAIAAADFFDTAAEQLRYAQVKSCDISFVDTGEKACVSAEFTCLENIGILRPMIIDKQISAGD